MLPGRRPRRWKQGLSRRDELNRGIRAGVVPGLVGGWVALLERFGTMTLREVLEPAIEYAEEGHPLDPFVADAIARSRALFELYPSTAAVFMPGGALPQPGQRFTYPDLARTFHKLVEAEETARLSGATREVGLRAAFTRFYRGDIAREMSRFYEEHDGLFTRGDFASYEPVWTEPVHTNYRGYDVYSSPPTSRGGLEVVMQLNLVEGFDVATMGHNSPEALHVIAESIKLAKADIYHFVTDPKHADTPICRADVQRVRCSPTRADLCRSRHVLPWTWYSPRGGTEFGPAERGETGAKARRNDLCRQYDQFFDRRPLGQCGCRDPDARE